MNRPARKNLYSLPRMTAEERVACMVWELLSVAVWTAVICGGVMVIR